MAKLFRLKADLALITAWAVKEGHTNLSAFARWCGRQVGIEIGKAPKTLQRGRA